MADELVKFMLDEVASDGGQGSTINRFIHLFSQPHSPAILGRPVASTSDASGGKAKGSNARPLFSPAEQQALEKHAAYVWRSMCSIDGIHVYRLPGAKKQAATDSVPPADPEQASVAMESFNPYEDPVEEGEEPRVSVEDAIIDLDLVEAPAAAPEQGQQELEVGLLSVEEGAGDMLRLREMYGNKVVMRASDKNILFALTGDTTKSSRYASLQEETCEAIARSRGRGISMIQITNQVKGAGGDAKKAHYAVKILGALGLVIKLRTVEQRTSTSLMVHRKYADLNKQLQIRKELVASGIEHDPNMEEDQEDAPIDNATGFPQFEPFGREHLKLYGFVVARLTRLLRCNLWHHLLQYHKVLDILGFEHTPTTADRRLFTKHVRKMRNEGLIEVVAVPGVGGFTTRCLRLAEFRPQGGESFEVDNPYAMNSGFAKADMESGQDADNLDVDLDMGDGRESRALAPSFNMQQTLEYQILNHVRLSGKQGSLIADIADRLCNLERKTVEHALARYEDVGQVPSNLQDYALFSMSVTIGKARRTLYFNIAGLREKCQAEDLPVPKGLAELETSVGEVSEIAASRLCDSIEAYNAHLDRLCRDDSRSVHTNKIGKKKLGRPRKVQPVSEVKVEEEEEDGDIGPRGRPRKYVRLVDLRGQLIRRRKKLDIKREANYPACLLYNEMTGIFFNAPEGYNGFEPVPTPPAQWHTAKRSRVVGTDGKVISVPKPPSAVKLAKWRARAAAEQGIDAESIGEVAESEPAPPPKRRKTGRRKKGQVEDSEAAVDPTIGDSRLEGSNAGLAGDSEAVAPASPAGGVIDPSLMEIDGVAHDLHPAEAMRESTADVHPQTPLDESTPAASTTETTTGRPAKRGRGRRSSPSQMPAAKKARKVKEPVPTAQTPTAENAAAPEPAAVPEIAALAELEAVPEPAGAQKPTRKRPSNAMPQRYNANALIRQRDTEACLKAIGGIALRDASFLVMLQKWYAEQVAAGLKRASEMPGRSDRRTVDRSIESLITDGKVRGVHVSTGDALDKPIRLITLPDVQPSAIQAWLGRHQRQTLPRSYDVVQKQGATEGDASVDAARFTSLRRKARLVKIPKEEAARALHTPGEILDGMTAEECRDLFLKDWRVVPQTYGLIPGRLRRAETLHMALLSYLESEPTAQRVVPLDWMFEGMSIGTFCSCFPITVLDSELSALCNSVATSGTPLRECPPHVLASVGISRRPMRKKVMDVLSTLVKLGIARLSDEHGATLSEERSDQATHVELARAVTVRNYSQTDPGCPIATVRPVENTRHAVDYWYTLWYIASSRSETERAKIEELAGQAPDLAPTFDDYPAEDETFKFLVVKPSPWQQTYQLTRAQRKHISWKVHSRAPELDPLSESNSAVIDLAMRVFAPYDVVKKQVAKLERARVRARQNEDRLSVPDDQKRKTKRAAEQVRQALADKLRQRQEELENQWDMLYQHALAQVPIEGGDELAAYLAPIRKEFMRNAGSFNPRKVVLALEAYKTRKEQGVQREARLRKAIKLTANPGSRTRTTWTAEAEEMARDAYAIMQCRLRRLPHIKANKRQFDALSQLWPEVDPKRVGERVKRWLKEREAHVAYFDRLCMAWEKQVKLHRGNPELPDPNPNSLNDFDLLAHVLFLRQNVKKGILLRNVGEIRDEDRLPPLPASVAEIGSTASVAPLRNNQTSEGFSLFWGREGESSTEGLLLRTSALTLEARNGVGAGESPAEEEAALAQTAVKMLLAKSLVEEPTSVFDSAAAQILLKQIKPDVAKRGLDALRSKQWVSERPQAHATPGSGFEYSSAYKHRLSEPIPFEVLDQADALLQDLGGEGQTYDWPLTCTSGEFASLMTLVAHDKVNFEIDVEPCFRMFAAKGEYSTKALDDPDEEVALRFSAKSLDVNSSATTGYSPSEKAVQAVMEAVQSRGSNGATLRDIVNEANISSGEALLAGSHLLRDPDSGIAGVGYTANRLARETDGQPWRLACTSKDGTTVHVAPRQWLDENGRKVGEIWEQCVAKLYSTIVQRPGISETALRDLVAGILDRQEVNDVLSHLLDRTAIKRVIPSSLDLPELKVIAEGVADRDIEDLIQYVSLPEWSIWTPESAESGASEA